MDRQSLSQAAHHAAKDADYHDAAAEAAPYGLSLLHRSLAERLRQAAVAYVKLAEAMK